MKDKAVSKHTSRKAIKKSSQRIDQWLSDLTEQIGTENSVYLLVDTSSSMAGDNIQQARLGAADFAKDALSKGYSVGIISFDSYPIEISGPLQSLEEISSHLADLAAGGSTNMEGALKLGQDKLEKKFGTKVMVLVTDGAPDSVEAALDAAESAKLAAIDIITIGTDDADRDFLQKIASKAELTVMVNGAKLSEGIASAAKLLPE